jgi:hypothetical protein
MTVCYFIRWGTGLKSTTGGLLQLQEKREKEKRLESRNKTNSIVSPMQWSVKEDD